MRVVIARTRHGVMDMKRWPRAFPLFLITAAVVPFQDLRRDRARPQPYRLEENVLRLAEGRWWGVVGGLAIDVDGRSIWVAERCGGDRCRDSRLNPVLKFNDRGTLVGRFGEQLFDRPHGLHVDAAGNIWVTDVGGPAGAPERSRLGHVVRKFSPDGRLLLTLGRSGVRGDGHGEVLAQPSAVVTGPRGEVFVADGSEDDLTGGSRPPVARIVKYGPDGTLGSSWGRVGSGPGEFRDPHALALDSRGRLFVADRGNDRIQLFDVNGQFLGAWRGFGRPSDLVIDRADHLYVASDGPPAPGIYVAQARDGRRVAFIPQPAHRIAVDARGRLYAAAHEPDPLGPKRLVRLGEGYSR